MRIAGEVGGPNSSDIEEGDCVALLNPDIVGFGQMDHVASRHRDRGKLKPIGIAAKSEGLAAMP
jgi:hypothetical protein